MSLAKKKVLVISSNFAPEASGIGVYSSDLAFEILRENFEVAVITGLPHYPWWRTPDEFSHLVPGKSTVNGIELIRIKHVIPSNSGAIGRIQLEFSFWFNGQKLIKKLRDQHFDLVIAIIPTVASGLIARRIAKKIGIPGIVIFQDVTSLGTLQSGMFGAAFFYQAAKFLEARASKWASKILVVSEEMARVIPEIIKVNTIIEVVHNYSVFSASKMNTLEAKKFLNFPSDEFLLVHSGNIGHKQDLLNVVQTAKLLENQADIKFLIIGHGNQEQKIREAIVDCKNIEIRSFESEENYPIVLAAANALLVNERPSLREMSLPSKLTSYLNSERPVIAAVSNQSATSKFLKDAALIVEPGNPRALADSILRLKQDSVLQQSLAQLGKTAAIESLSATSGRNKYLEIIKEIFREEQI